MMIPRGVYLPPSTDYPRLISNAQQAADAWSATGLAIVVLVLLTVLA